MSIVIDNKKYLTTEEAAELGGYATDYVGQLCRKKKIDCKQISGHWFVSEDGLRAYTGKELVSPEKGERMGEMHATAQGDTCMYEGTEYISTARAAELTGYAQDYIGQLARSGEIAARKIGRRWFAGRDSLLRHKKEHELPEEVASKGGDNVSETMARAPFLDRATAHTNTPKSTHDTKVAITRNDYITSRVNKTAAPAEHVQNYNFNVRYTSETEKELVPTLSTERLAPDTTEGITIDRSNTIARPQPTIVPDRVEHTHERAVHPVAARRELLQREVHLRKTAKIQPRRRGGLLRTLFILSMLAISAYGVLYMLSGSKVDNTMYPVSATQSYSGTKAEQTHSVTTPNTLLQKLQVLVPGKTYQYMQ